MSDDHTDLTLECLSDSSRELIEKAFRAYLEKPLENPTESDYLRVILGLCDNIFRRSEIEVSRRAGRPKKDLSEKEDLYLAMLLTARKTGFGSDKAAQALFRENPFGRSQWTALKASYYTYRQHLIEAYRLAGQGIPENKLDSHLAMCIYIARPDLEISKEDLGRL